MGKLAYRDYMLGVLMVIMAFNCVDRLALGLLLQDIKGELLLSDTQLGLLTGIAFSLFYAVMGVPIARWADRGNRITIIALTTTLWSVAVALCGLAGSFVHLLLVRVMVAVGEAGCVPPAHSLIADYFNRAERPRAAAIYKLGLPLSMLIGFFLAGWLNQLFGWRVTFVLLGLPGPFLAALAWFTLKEPRRDPTFKPPDPLGAAASPAEVPSVREVCTTLWGNPTFRHLLLAYAIASFFGAGMGQWTPSFFIRTYGLSSGELGTWLAVIYGSAGLLGVYWGGQLASRHAARNEPLQLKVMALIYCLSVFLAAGKYLAPSAPIALAFMGVGYVFGSAIMGPLFAMMQTLVPERMRAMAIAILFLFANLIGTGLGPLAAGILSDTLQLRFGATSLRYALLILCLGYFWCAWHLWRASRTVAADIGPGR